MLLLFSARARDDIGFFGDQTGRSCEWVNKMKVVVKAERGFDL